MAKISKLLLKSLLISKSRAEEERFEVTSCNDPNSAVGFKIIYGQEKNSSEKKFLREQITKIEVPKRFFSRLTLMSRD